MTCLAFYLSTTRQWRGSCPRGVRADTAGGKKSAVCSTEDREGAPDEAELTPREKWSGPILERDPQDFLMDWAWTMSERGSTEDRRVFGQTKQHKG